MHRPRLLIVGPSGYLGGRTLQMAISQSVFEVFTLQRVDRTRPFDFRLSHGDKYEIGDIRDPKAFAPILQMDSVIYTAADTSKAYDLDSAFSVLNANTLLPNLVCSRLKDSSVHFLYTSTYSYKSDSGTYDPPTLYDASKFACEKLLEFYSLSANIRITIFHSYDIYGPSNPHGRLISSIVRARQMELPMEITPGLQEISPIYVDDVARILLLQSNSHEQVAPFMEYDLYGPDMIRVTDLPSVVSRALGLPHRPELFLKSKPYPAKQRMDFKPCHPLPPHNFSLVGLQQGIREIARLE